MRKAVFIFLFCCSFAFCSDFTNDLASGKIETTQRFDENSSVTEQLLPYDEVVKLYESGKYERAGNMFLSLMLQGDYRGAAYIAEIYEKGLAGLQDCDKAKVMLLYAVSKNYCIGYKKMLDWIRNDICIKFKDENIRKKRILEFERKLEKCIE